MLPYLSKWPLTRGNTTRKRSLPEKKVLTHLSENWPQNSVHLLQERIVPFARQSVLKNNIKQIHVSTDLCFWRHCNLSQKTRDLFIITHSDDEKL